MTFNSYDACQLILKQSLSLLNPVPRSIGIFGSFVRNMLQEGSDIDLLLIGDDLPRAPFKRTQWFSPLSESWRKHNTNNSFSPSPLSPIILSSDGWLNSTGLRLSTCKEIWILLDDGFLSQSMHESQQWLSQNLWEHKKFSDGGWCWIPKTPAA